MSKWSRIGNGLNKELARFSGKTYPSIAIRDSAIYGRDNNGKNPSSTFKAFTNINSIKENILPHISKPKPSNEDLEWLLAKDDHEKSCY